MRKQAVFGTIQRIEKTIQPLPDLQVVNETPSALNQQGEVFKYQTPKELFKYLVASQSKQLNGKTILDVIPNQRIHERHLKYLLKEYDAPVIVKAIQRASFHSKHVYSVKLIKYFCARIKDDELCRHEQTECKNSKA